MANYQLGKLYKIIDLDSNQCYIGSTCEPILLAKRLAKHLSDYRQHLKGKGRYITSNKLLPNIRPTKGNNTTTHSLYHKGTNRFQREQKHNLVFRQETLKSIN